MSAQHTPGPWRFEHDAESGHYAIVVQDEIVAEVFYDSEGAEGRVKHDACLIAAAPELLEALEDARSIVADELRVLIDSNTFYPVNGQGEGRIDPDAQPYINGFAAKLARFDDAIAKARGAA